MPSVDRMRIIRMLAWLIAMVATAGIVGVYAPKKVFFVPSFFLCIMVPAVLVPLHPKRKD